MVTKLRLCNELDQSGLKSTEIDKSLKFTTYDALGISVCGGYLATPGWSIPVHTCLNPYIDSLSHSFRQYQKPPCSNAWEVFYLRNSICKSFRYCNPNGDGLMVLGSSSSSPLARAFSSMPLICAKSKPVLS